MDTPITTTPRRQVRGAALVAAAAAFLGAAFLAFGFQLWINLNLIELAHRSQSVNAAAIEGLRQEGRQRDATLGRIEAALYRLERQAARKGAGR